MVDRSQERQDDECVVPNSSLTSPDSLSHTYGPLKQIDPCRATSTHLAASEVTGKLSSDETVLP